MSCASFTLIRRGNDAIVRRVGTLLTTPAS